MSQTGMTRTELKELLHNIPLIKTIEQKQDLTAARNELCAALETLRKTNVSLPAQDEVQRKINEYAEAARKYGEMIEDLWGITWQKERSIRKYIGCDDTDIDRLAEFIRF
jgi:hypothetical protein